LIVIIGQINFTKINHFDPNNFEVISETTFTHVPMLNPKSHYKRIHHFDKNKKTLENNLKNHFIRPSILWRRRRNVEF